MYHHTSLQDVLSYHFGLLNISTILYIPLGKTEGERKEQTLFTCSSIVGRQGMTDASETGRTTVVGKESHGRKWRLMETSYMAPPFELRPATLLPGERWLGPICPMWLGAKLLQDSISGAGRCSALPEDLGSTFISHIVFTGVCNSSVRGSDALFCPTHGHRHPCR